MKTGLFSEVGERLTWARENAGLSQSQAAKLLGTTKATINQVETGKIMSSVVTSVSEWCKVYDISERWLMFGEEREVVIPDDWKLAQEDRESLTQTLGRMRQVGSDQAIFNGKHLVAIKDMHQKGRTAQARVEFTTNFNDWESAWVNVRSLAPIPEDLSQLPENTRLKIELQRAEAKIKEMQDFFDTKKKRQYFKKPEPTHAFVALCPTCRGIDAATVDDGSRDTGEMIIGWQRDGREYTQAKLPVKLSCTCPRNNSEGDSV